MRGLRLLRQVTIGRLYRTLWGVFAGGFVLDAEVILCRGEDRELMGWSRDLKGSIMLVL